MTNTARAAAVALCGGAILTVSGAGEAAAQAAPLLGRLVMNGLPASGALLLSPESALAQGGLCLLGALGGVAVLSRDRERR